MGELTKNNLIDNFSFNIDKKAKIVKVMPEDCKPFGFSIKSLLSKALVDFLPKDSQSKFLTYFKEPTLNKPSVLECEIKCKNGEKVWYKIFIFFGAFAKGGKCVVHFNSINEYKIELLKNADTIYELKKNNEINYQVIQSTETFFVRLNIDNSIASIGKLAVGFFGNSYNDLVGENFFEKIIPFKQIAQFQRSFDVFINSQKDTKTITTTFINKAGFKKTVSWKIDKIFFQEKFCGTAWIGKDVSESANKIELLQESESRFKTLAQLVQIPLSIISIDGAIMFVNKAYVKEYGFELSEIPNVKSLFKLCYKKISERKLATDAWERELEALKKYNRILFNKATVYTKQGSKKLVEYSAVLKDGYIYYSYLDITAYIEREELLHQAREGFKRIAENTPVAIAGADIETSKIVFANKLFVELVGYSIDEINEMSDWGSIIRYDDADDEEKSIAAWQAIKLELLSQSSSLVKILERRIECKNGSVKTFQIGITYDNHNTVYAIFQDITEQRKAEQRLMESEQRFRNIVEHLPIPLVTIKPITGEFFSNKKHQNLIGHHNSSNKKAKDFSKFSIDDLVEENSKKHFAKLIEKIKKNDEATAIFEPTYAVKILCKDKVIRTFEITENIFGNTLYTVFHDITEQLNATELLLQSERKFKAIAENMPIAIGAYDATGKTIFVNKHFTDTTGYTIVDVPTIKEWYYQTQPNAVKRFEFYEYWNKTIENFRKGTLKVKPEIKASSRCKDGSFKYFTYSFSIFNETTYILLIDITEQERAKKELEKSYQELRSLASHLQNIREEERRNISREIHDQLGQELTGIKMDVSAIFKKIKSAKTVQETEFKQVLDMLNLSVKTVRKISSELRPSLLDDLGLSAAIEWQALEFSKRAGVICNFNNGLNNQKLSPEVESNLFRIVQESLTNIMRHAQAKNVYIDLQSDGETVFIGISDDGKGFNKNLPTSTLGLLGMQERTIVMKGKFEVESSKGKGTTVKISVPLKTIKK